MHLRVNHLLLPVALILSSISPAFASDTAPPQLVDWSTAGGADIKNSDGQVRATFILSDDSEIDTPKLLLKSLTTSQMTPFATVRAIQKNGKLTSYEATAVVQKGQAPKLWEWVLYPLSDSLGNRDSTFGPGNKWKPQVNIFNTDYTVFTFRCEQGVTVWNEAIRILESAERKYPDYPEFKIFRMKQDQEFKQKDFSVCAGRNDFEDPLGAYAQMMKNDVLQVIEQVTAKAADAADKAAADKAAADKAAADKAAADKAAAKPVAKEKTIICLKGKSSLKVIGKNPKCPAGYKVKK